MNSKNGKWPRMVISSFMVVIAILSTPHLAFSDNPTKLHGIWKLVSFVQEVQETGERRFFFGKNPTGYIILLPEGRMMACIEADGRKAPQTDEDRANLHKTMFAYTGIYRIEGDKFITKVDVSWNPAWNGTDQIRFFKLEGDRLEIVSAWAPSPTIPGRPMTRGFFAWERVK